MEMTLNQKIKWLRQNFRPYSVRWYNSDPVRTEQMYEREQKITEKQKIKSMINLKAQAHYEQNEWLAQWIQNEYGKSSSELTIAQKKKKQFPKLLKDKLLSQINTTFL